MTRAWDLSLRVAAKGFAEWDAVSYAFERTQKQRFFQVGFTDHGDPGEVRKGLVADFAGDAPAGDADVEDGFEVLGRVLAALRGQIPKPRLN